MFKCVQIDDYKNDSYVESDPNLMCWTIEHFRILLMGALPMLVIWGIGTPLYIWYRSYMLYKGKMQTMDHSILSVYIDYYHDTVSYTHLRAHETGRNLVCRLLLEKKKSINTS
eukprot:TRINITY_DN25603_c0_g1_i1.p1 TRINITY_DN25603_c0_g1~~TRINITY_DN25603_c0_g1_i1.p1  ORF type:complete len:113 (-),score=6.99 TRINITY_DN25603_c0_g1_i1:130-468(-)